MTGPFAKISPFVRYQFGLASGAFAGTGTKTLTVTMTLDPGGRPVKITASGTRRSLTRRPQLINPQAPAH